MSFLSYEYKMKILYSEPVDRCYFTIKGIPSEDFRERSISYEIDISPKTTYSESMDSFGNIQIIGSEPSPHTEFIYRIKGLVETFPVSMSGGIDENTIGMYKYPHGLCIPGEQLKKFADEIRLSLQNMQGNIQSDGEIVYKIMDMVHSRMEYMPGSTEIETTAEEAFASGKGVCQDFSHVFITLIRLFGIPARYVCGLIVGEGKSHAWVEVALDGKYIPLDPTNNSEVTEEYIKFGVGRDAKDCAINRGVMWGGGKQTQEITVKVDKLY